MLSVTFLGTGAACPTVDRNVTSLAVQREGEMFLLECGEGTQRQMMRYGVGFSFRDIFFSHYHSDHFLGVTGLIRTMGLPIGTAPVVLYGPRGAQRILGGMLTVGIEKSRFPVEIVEVKPGDSLKRDGYDLEVFATEHRADTVGYALREHYGWDVSIPSWRARWVSRRAALGQAAQGRDGDPARWTPGGAR